MGEEKRKAYEVLGVKEGASKEEIERRFSILMKKYRSSHSDTPGSDTSQVDIDRITRAYNLLMGYEEEDSGEKTQRSKASPISNFLYYYKFHIIIGIIIVAVLISIISSFLGREPVDLSIAFIGDFYYTETDTLKKNIKENMPELRGITIDGAVISDKLKSQQEYAMQMKAVALFAAGEVDVFILDENIFNKYAYQGAFASLDHVSSNIEIDGDEKYILKVEGQDKKALYGIDVSKSKLFEGWSLAGSGKRIVAIGNKAKNYKNAVKFIKMLVN